MKRLMNIFVLCIFFLFPAKDMAVTITNDSVTIDSVKRDLSLCELVVKADRIRQKPGGYVVSLTGSDLAKGKDINSLLAALPGLTFEEGAIKIHGQPPAAVYLDGVHTSMDFIKNLPSERIASVEVAWDAGRDELAGAGGGVIRIKTKRELGLAGTVRGTAQWLRDENGSLERLNPFISFGTKRLTIYNNLSLYNSGINGRYEESRTMPDALSTFTNEKLKIRQKMLQDWFNLSYDIAHNHQLSASGMFYYNDRTDNNATMTDDADGNRQTGYRTPGHLLMGQAVAMYNWDIDSLGSYLRVTADYLRRKNYQKQVITQSLAGHETNIGQASTKQETDMVRIRPTWYKVFNGKSQMSAGLDFRYIHYDNASSNAIASVNAVMTSYTPAAYATYYGSIGRSLGYNVGVRVQYDNMTVKMNGGGRNAGTTINTYKKCNVNPSLSVNYAINKNKGHSLYFSYSHYVGEMPYDAISTFRNYDEADHYTVGNPEINPESGHYAGLTLTMFKNYSLNVSYSYYKNSVYYTNDVDPDDNNILRSMARNTDHESLFSVGLEQKVSPFKWWTLKANERFNLYSGTTPDWKYTNQVHWTFLVNNDFRFGKTWGGNLYAYVDPSCNVQDQWWNTVVDITCNVYKTFMNDRLTVRLDAKPYRKGRQKITDNMYYRSVRTNTTKEEYVGLTVSYSFNTGKVKNRRSAQSTQYYNTISRPSM